IETYEHAGDFKEPRTRNGWRSSQRTRPKPSEVTVTAPRPGRAHKISGVILIVAGAAWEVLEEVLQCMPQSLNAVWQLMRIEPLAEVLRPFGDLVAIGRAGEQLPTPGAARIYASDAKWKSRQASDAGSSTRIKQGQRRGKSSLGAEASC